MASSAYTLYYGIQYFPQMASWGLSNIIYPLFSSVYSKLFHKEEIRTLSPMEAELFDKLKKGELRMYEVAAPSMYDSDGIHTRYIILERPYESTKFCTNELEYNPSPVFL